MGANCRVFLTADQIHSRVVEIGKEITRRYAGGNLLLVGIMKGSLVFLADLIRQLDADTLDYEIEFMGVSSYEGTKSTGNVRIIHDLTCDIKDRDVLIVEDIVDTAITLDYLLANLGTRKPKSLSVCSLLSKPEVHRKNIPIDFVGFEIKNVFVVGYGLDDNQRLRGLPYIGELLPGSES